MAHLAGPFIAAVDPLSVTTDDGKSNAGGGAGWLLSPLAPNLPAWQRLCYIEACHKLALLDWLICWAEEVENGWRDAYTCYPFERFEGPGPLWINLAFARETLTARMREADPCTVAGWVDQDLTTLANTLALARGLPARVTWDGAGLTDLTYTVDLLKC